MAPMAWLMGLIVHFNGPLPSGEPYSGWVDAASKAPIADHEVKARPGDGSIGGQNGTFFSTGLCFQSRTGILEFGVCITVGI